MPESKPPLSNSYDADSGDQSSHSSDEVSDTDPFIPILNAIRLEALVSAALDARSKSDNSQKIPVSTGNLPKLSCVVETPPLIGSFNLAYAILFLDGTKWIARIPGNGVTSFGPLEARKMLSDIQTTSLIRSATSIPIPQVFAWNVDRDNPVGVPYHFESFVEGKPLSERWTDTSWTTESKRVQTLRKLAQVMSQLHNFRFDKIGSLIFDADGKFSQIGDLIKVDRDVSKMLDGEEVWGTTSTIGPFETTRSYLLDKLDDLEVPEAQAWTKAENALLRLAIDSTPQSLDRNGKFTLGHPDLNYQNIFVDDDGNIKGLIDWDGMHTLPRALGFARYPSWITRDWDPVKYGYGLPDSREEDSPEQLISYRREYATALANLQLPPADYSVDDTRLSQILEAIEIAVEDTICRSMIIQKLLQYAFDGTVPFTFPEFSDLWLANQAHEWMAAVREAFEGMWHAEQNASAYQVE
ncbi:MAG: hypothetical protein Q9217_000121 [Psora testacea]